MLKVRDQSNRSGTEWTSRSAAVRLVAGQRRGPNCIAWMSGVGFSTAGPLCQLCEVLGRELPLLRRGIQQQIN